MNLFPITQPTLALSIAEEALYLVEVKKSWRTTALKEVKHIPLPSGTIRLSSAKPNIENMEVFLEQLHTLAEPLKKPISIALSLPDLCARTSVFDFSTFPTKTIDQTALLNWRFQQDLKLDTTQSRLWYAVYVSTSLASRPNQQNPDNVRVLGIAIRNEIVEQYERACLDLNLIPVSVSLSSLDIFDLYQATIQTILETEDCRATSASSRAMFLFISHWGFTFFAFHDGCPSFVRTKAITIRQDSSAEQWHTSASDKKEDLRKNSGEDGGYLSKAQDLHKEEGSVSAYPSYTATKVAKEILATLQYYVETFSQNDSTPSLATLFVVSDLEHGHRLLPASEHIQQTAKVSGTSVADIQITQLSPTMHFNQRENLFGQESQICSALPGYASVRVA